MMVHVLILMTNSNLGEHVRDERLFDCVNVVSFELDVCV